MMPIFCPRKEITISSLVHVPRQGVGYHVGYLAGYHVGYLASYPRPSTT